jgi:hypothetical protein
MNKLWISTGRNVHNRPFSRGAEIHPHCRAIAPQVSPPHNGAQRPGAEGISRLSRISAGLIYYY